jgi:hypothetical protein
MSVPRTGSATSPWMPIFVARREALMWLIAAMVGFSLTAIVLRDSPLQVYASFAVAALFAAGYMRAGRRLVAVPCPKCGGRFFDRPLPTPASRYVNPFAFAPHCEHCGVKYLAPLTRASSPAAGTVR